MKITLLGTGSAEGWPGLFCTCHVCRRSRQLRGRNIRSRSSAMLDGVVKIDLSPDTFHHVVTHDLDLTRLEFLVFTHPHDDHLAPAELQYLSWMFVPEPITRPLPVLGSRSVTDKIKAFLADKELPLDIQCMEPWITVTRGEWSVTPVMAHHDPSNICFNLIVSRAGKSLLYATDTGWYDPPTWQFLERAKLDGIVVEVSRGPEESGYEGHLSIPEAIRLRERLVSCGTLPRDAPVVTTHHSHLGGLLHDEMEALLNPHGIQVGYDGLTFEI
jgi:phosphoribosyl 1,2-cyclic phosphate phosphodiesterase